MATFFTKIFFDPATTSPVTTVQGQSPQNVEKLQINSQPLESRPSTTNSTPVPEMDATKDSSTKEPIMSLVTISVSLVTQFWTSVVYLSPWLIWIRFPTFERLWIWDLRTFRPYSIPIANGAVEAVQFARISPLGIKASRQEHIANGLIVYDPGYRNTAVRSSQTTRIDGNKGDLSYRGYPVGYLFENHSYEDVVHLLIWKTLPTPEQKRQFRINVAKEMKPDTSVVRVIEAFNHDAETYLMIAAGLSAWAASNPQSIPVCAGDKIYLGKTEATDEAICRTIAALMTVTAIVSCYKEERTFTADIDSNMSPIDNMLRMMGRVDEQGNADKKTSATINKLWILFADHEMTNSTAAFLHASSTLSDPISSSASAILSAQGPLHAGAVDLAFKRFGEITGSSGGVKQHLEDIKAKKYRAMGVGHRIYRTEDPRTVYLKQLISQFAVEFASNPLLEVAMAIDDAVQHDEYFTSRKLCVNADLYGSFVYSALGLHTSMITPMAFIARSAGIYSYWRESMHEAPCIWRPRQVFTGNPTAVL